MISNTQSHRLCIAPMMTHTDRHFRYFLRLISKHVFLYTEMITTGAIIHGKQYERLKYSDVEHPLALQLGGNNANELSICASIAEQFGYDEINLNIGCPSDRVKNGAFGACLMAEPERVADCVAGIKTRVSLPVTVKTRTGIDDMDSYEHLYRFIDIVATAGCRTFIVHARKALLKGLSPRQNREIPPLNYEMVHRIKEDFPQLEIIINGGITTFDQGLDQLNKVDGVMIGRVVCNNPYILAEADKIFFNDDASPQSRTDILKKYMDYIDTQLEDGYPLPQLSRHILGLFQGQPGARLWRRYLSENIYNRDSGLEVIEDAFHFIRAA
jgi:tRNA-dihydrouridine synthase A